MEPTPRNAKKPGPILNRETSGLRTTCALSEVSYELDGSNVTAAPNGPAAHRAAARLAVQRRLGLLPQRRRTGATDCPAGGALCRRRQSEAEIGLAMTNEARQRFFSASGAG